MSYQALALYYRTRRKLRETLKPHVKTDIDKTSIKREDIFLYQNIWFFLTALNLIVNIKFKENKFDMY